MRNNAKNTVSKTLTDSELNRLRQKFGLETDSGSEWARLTASGLSSNEASERILVPQEAREVARSVLRSERVIENLQKCGCPICQKAIEILGAK